MNVHGALLVERLAALTFSAGLPVFLGIEAVDGFGKNTGAGGLAHTSRSAEQVGVGQLSVLDGVLECCRQSTLPNNAVEGRWPVFACRNYKFIHV